MHFLNRIHERGAVHILILVAAIALVAFILISSSVEFKNKLFGQLFPKPTSRALSDPITGGASLALNPSSGIFNRDCTYSININLDTGGYDTNGVDVIINFDKTAFTIESVTEGSLFSGSFISFDNNTGRILISWLGGGFNGSGKFSTIKLRVNNNPATTSGTITFDFDPTDPLKTTDSNVVKSIDVIDLLRYVTNGTYTISIGACPLKTGDINGDGSIGVLDFAILLSKWNTPDSGSDLNGDGSVGVIDFSILLANWGT